jgi:hypothetical protein
MQSAGLSHHASRAERQFAARAYYLSTLSASLAIPAIKYVKGNATLQMGKTGEVVAAKILHQEMNITVTEITKSKGVDLKGYTRGKSDVSVEVKTSGRDKPFDKLLGRGYGHKQCSDEWFTKVGVDPSKTRVLGVQINPDKKTVSIYRRMSNDASSWKCLLHNKPLSEFDLNASDE